MNPVGFDTTFLSILLNPRSRIPTDPATGEPIAQAKRRAERLVETLGKERRKIVIPTPVTASFLDFLRSAQLEVSTCSRQYAAILSSSVVIIAPESVVMFFVRPNV